MQVDELDKFADLLIAEFKQVSYVTNPDNVMEGQSDVYMNKDVTYFPRLEFIIEDLQDIEYSEQKLKRKNLMVSVSGILHRDAVEVTNFERDMTKFALETSNRISDINGIIVKGINPNLPTTLNMIDATVKVMFDYYSDDKIGMFYMFFEALFEAC